MSELQELKLEPGWLEYNLEYARVHTEEMAKAYKRTEARMKKWKPKKEPTP